MLLEGGGLAKFSLSVSQRWQKLRNHCYASLEYVLRHTHTQMHTHSYQLSERLGIALLISFSVDTQFLSGCLLSQLCLSPCLYPKAGDVFLTISSGRRLSSYQDRGAVVDFGPAAQLFTQPPFPTVWIPGEKKKNSRIANHMVWSVCVCVRCGSLKRCKCIYF